VVGLGLGSRSRLLPIARRSCRLAALVLRPSRRTPALAQPAGCGRFDAHYAEVEEHSAPRVVDVQLPACQVACGTGPFRIPPSNRRTSAPFTSSVAVEPCLSRMRGVCSLRILAPLMAHGRSVVSPSNLRRPRVSLPSGGVQMNPCVLDCASRRKFHSSPCGRRSRRPHPAPRADGPVGHLDGLGEAPQDLQSAATVGEFPAAGS